MVKVFVPTCAKYYWALPPFFWFMAKYWPGQEVKVAGFEPLPFEISRPFSFVSLGPVSWPAQQWSDQIIAFLEGQNDPHWIMMHEDFWLMREADDCGIALLHDYCRAHQDVLRLDLTNDRHGAPGWREICSVGHLDVIESDPHSPYHWSHQAGIWNTGLWLEALEPGLSPWQMETAPSIRAQRVFAKTRVLGTRQWPLRYVPTVFAGDSRIHWNGYNYARGISIEDRLFVEQQQWLPSR